MKKITVLFMTFVFLFVNAYVPVVTAAETEENRILQFEDNFDDNANYYWTLGAASLTNEKLHMPDKFNIVSLNRSVTGNDAQVAFNDCTLEFDLMLYESKEMHFFMVFWGGHRIIFREAGFRYLIGEETTEYRAQDIKRELNVLYNLRFTLTDDLLLGYIKKDGETSYKNVLAVARQKGGGSGLSFGSYIQADIDNVKIYSMDSKTKNALNKKISRIPVAGTHKIEIANSTKENVKYESLHPEIATVAADGTVTGLARGTAMIQLSDGSGDVFENVMVKVYDTISSIKMIMTDSNRTFEVGDTFCVTCEAQPSTASLLVEWSVDKPEILEKYGESNVSQTFTALAPGVATIRIQDAHGPAFAEMELTIVPKAERTVNENALDFALTGRKTEISDSFLGVSGNIHTRRSATVEKSKEYNDVLQLQSWRQMDLFPQDAITDRPVEEWFPELNPTFMDCMAEHGYETIIHLQVRKNQGYTIESELEIVKYLNKIWKGDRPLVFELGNENYSISNEKNFPTAEEYFNYTAELADRIHELYPENRVIAVLVGQPMETNILSDPLNIAQLEGDWAYSQPHRIIEWNSTAEKYKDHFDGFTIHTYSSHTVVGGVTPAKNWQQLTGYAQQDYYGYLNTADRFGDDVKFSITEYGQLVSEVFWGTNFDAGAKIRHQRGKYPVAAMSYMEHLLYMAKTGVISETNYHSDHDNQGFGIYDTNLTKLPNYYAFVEMGRLFNENNVMYDLQSITQDYDVVLRPYYWGGDENINQNSVEAWGLGDETGVKEIIFSNRTDSPKKIKVNGAKLKPTWGYGGSEALISPGWMKNETYTERYSNPATLPNADELIPLPNTYDGAVFEDEIIIPPLSITVAKIEGTPEVIQGHSSQKLSKLTEYRLSHALALKVNNPVAYNDNIKTQVDVNNSAIVPVVKDGRTLLPLRFVAESFGCEVYYDDATQGIEIKNDDTLITLTVGKKEYTVNGKEYEFDVPAEVTDGRTLVPLRALAEALDKDVLWDSRGIIIITNKWTAFKEYDETTGVVDKGHVDETSARMDEIISLFE